MSKTPKISALSIFLNSEEESHEVATINSIGQSPMKNEAEICEAPKVRNQNYLKQFFDENEWKIYTNLINKSEVKTSSMGRFFDAVSFVLGFEKPIFFEGESAMWLEKFRRKLLKII
jgi:hydrogenase maturation factor HypF (carbamoyltransferase family)